MVEQEIGQISKIRAGNTYLNENFTRTVFDQLTETSGVDLVHLSTHAEFLPGGPEKSRLFLGEGSLSIKEFSQIRLAREDSPFELFTLSACRTALGDRESELGLAGLALQAGSKTAIGSFGMSMISPQQSISFASTDFSIAAFPRGKRCVGSTGIFKQQDQTFRTIRC